ncbi:MAG: MFS transporter, partial [Caulobacterales bacterium]
MSENGRETSISSDAWSMPRRHYVLAVLCLVGIFNFVDRQIITILIEPIKKEFGASDTQMGLLTGLMFAGFYLAASIPLARIADTGSRRNLMVICLGCWSAMTALGGFAQSFIQLLLTRIGVALGEAGAGPASHSMISDLYPMRRRGTMLSIFIAAQSIGIGLGVFLGGLLGDMFNWRVAFVIVGVPGVLLAVLLLTTVKEPPRGMADNVSETAKPPPVFVTMKRLLGMPSYVCAVLTSMFGAIPGYGTLIWGPTFFLRVHELSAATVGFWFGIVSGAALFIGGISGGMVGDWAARRDVRWYMRLGGIG